MQVDQVCAESDAMLMLQSNIISQDLFKANDFMFRFDWLVLQHQNFFYNEYNVC